MGSLFLPSSRFKVPHATLIKNSFIFFLLCFFALPGVHSAEPLPSQVQVITKQDIEGHHYYSLADVLKGQTLLNVEQLGYRGSHATVRMRGASSSKQILILIDGMPLNHQYDSEVDLSQIPINIAERIEITKGGSSLSYSGEAVAGAINIITARPEEKGLDVTLDSHAGRDGVTGSKGKILGRSFWGDISYMGGLQRSSGYLYNEELDTSNHYGKFSRSFNGKGYIGGEFFFNESEMGQPNGTLFPFDSWNRKLEREPSTFLPFKNEELRFAKGVIGSPKFLGGHLFGSVTKTFRNITEFPREIFPADRDQDNSTLFSEAKWQGHGLEFGGQKKEDDRKIFPGSRIKTHMNSAYIQQKIAVSKLTVLPSVRYDNHSHLRGKTNPRLVIVFTPSSHFQISGTAQRAIRVPTYDELFISTSGNLNLNPETSRSYELGVTGGLNGIAVGVNGFYKVSKDIIHRTSTSTLYMNNGNEHARGIETHVSVTMGKETGFRHITLYGQLLAQRTRQNLRDGTGYNHAPLIPRRLGVAQLIQHLPRRIKIINEIRYEGEKFQFANEKGLRLPSQTVWNVRFRIAMLKSVFYFDVENVTQRRFADALATFTSAPGVETTTFSPQPERTFIAGFSIKFWN